MAWKLGKRTEKLVREAMVMAFVQGTRWGRATTWDDKVPRDSEIVHRVLVSAVRNSDLYPTLSKLDAALEADAAQREQGIADIVALMNASKNGGVQ
jgi:hypothetical protein